VAQGIFTLESTSFKDNSEINTLHTCENGNVSPELHWSGAPQGTQSFALICEDPDAPTAEPFVHWVIYDIPGTQERLTEGIERKPDLANGIKQGLNTLESIGYDGPCPPGTENHRYFFTLYALDSTLKAEAGLTKSQLADLMHGHILSKTTLLGTYKLLHKPKA
jgi:Raf kinase inhibitor-like YbhB/YbcL family protein